MAGRSLIKCPRHQIVGGFMGIFLYLTERFIRLFKLTSDKAPQDKHVPSGARSRGAVTQPKS